MCDIIIIINITLMRWITIRISKNKLNYWYLVAKYLKLNKFYQKFVKIIKNIIKYFNAIPWRIIRYIGKNEYINK